jgi:hypothetical protein
MLFYEDSFRHSKVDRRDTETDREDEYRISLLYRSRLKINA